MKKLLGLTVMLSFLLLACTQDTGTETTTTPATDTPAETTEAITEAATESTTTEATATEAAGDEIGDAEAKRIALEKAGVQESEIRDYDMELDDFNGRRVYDIDFEVGDVDYEYAIDVLTGEVLKEEID